MHQSNCIGIVSGDCLKISLLAHQLLFNRDNLLKQPHQENHCILQAHKYRPLADLIHDKDSIDRGFLLLVLLLLLIMVMASLMASLADG